MDLQSVVYYDLETDLILIDLESIGYQRLELVFDLMNLNLDSWPILDKIQ